MEQHACHNSTEKCLKRPCVFADKGVADLPGTFKNENKDSNCEELSSDTVQREGVSGARVHN